MLVKERMSHPEVQVIQNYGRGPLIALVRGTRVALGGGETAKVLVQEMNDDRRARNP